MTWEIFNAAIVAVTGISIIGFILPCILPDANNTARNKLPVLQRLSILPMSLFVCILSFVVGLATGHHGTDGNEFSPGMFFGLGAVMLLYVGDMIYIAHGVKHAIRIITGGPCLGDLLYAGFRQHIGPIVSRITASILFCLGIILFCMDKYPYGLFAVAVAGSLTPLVLQKGENPKKYGHYQNEDSCHRCHNSIASVGSDMALTLKSC